jgi:LysM repeat protein
MSHSNPLLPPGSSLEDRKHRKTKILVTVFGIVALHVIPISGLLLMQGCKPEIDSIATSTVKTPNEEVPLLNTNDLYQDYETSNPNLSVPLETETPPYNSAGQNLEPTISTEVILDEPGEGEITQPPVTLAHVELAPQQPIGSGEGNVIPQHSQPENEGGSSLPAPMTLDYKIKAGDRLYSLAREYGTKVDAIMGANPGLDAKRLKVGQSIVIPRNSNSVAAAVPAASSSRTPVGSGKAYQVKRGDTLTRIASKNGITLSALRRANGLNSDRILIGQKLEIPVAEVASAVSQ